MKEEKLCSLVVKVDEPGEEKKKKKNKKRPMEKPNIDNRSDYGSKLHTYRNVELERKSMVIITGKQKTFLWKKAFAL